MYWRPDGAGWVRIQMRTTSLRNFSNSVYPALPVSFGGNSKSRRSLLSGVYARGSKRSHQSALECVGPNCRGLHHAPTLNSIPPECDYAAEKTLPCTCIGRRRIPLRQLRFGTLAIPFTPPCQCLSEETLKAVCPFYLVSMPGEVQKDHTSLPWKYVTCRGLHHS